jgi:hypothetical protein
MNIKWPEMPKYFFHVRIDGALIEDADGLELPDADSIRNRCAEAINEIVAEEKWRGATDCEFQIVDELGRTIAVVPFRS